MNPKLLYIFILLADDLEYNTVLKPYNCHNLNLLNSFESFLSLKLLVDKVIFYHEIYNFSEQFRYKKHTYMAKNNIDHNPIKATHPWILHIKVMLCEPDLLIIRHRKWLFQKPVLEKQ